jgi:hypothetical protein
MGRKRMGLDAGQNCGKVKETRDASFIHQEKWLTAAM